MITHLPLTVDSIHTYIAKDKLSSLQVIILQHLREDTYYFIHHLLDAWVHIRAVFWKPLSVDYTIVKRIEAHWIPVTILPYDTLDSSTHMLPVLKSMLHTKSVRTLFLEVGCYFWQHIKKLPNSLQKNIIWIIEITKFWHNRYESILKHDKSFSVPVVSLACSSIKKIEALFVTQSWIDALSHVFRSINYTLYWKKVWLIGFGMIHQALVSWLKNYKVSTYVYDINKKLQKDVRFVWIKWKSKKSLLQNSQIIFSATGQQSINCDDIEKYGNNHLILVSFWSRWREFPVKDMDKNWKNKRLNQYIDSYTTTSWKTIFLINKWVAINYLLQSCVAEVMDVYFSEMVYAIHMLLSTNLSTKKIHHTPKHMQKKLINQREVYLKKSIPIT
jgi:S-adenosylhomocysteine hydrolase